MNKFKFYFKCLNFDFGFQKILPQSSSEKENECFTLIH